MRHFIRKFRGTLRRRWDRAWSEPHSGLRRLGDASPWHIRADLLTSESVVLSGGVGRDISFELQLASEYGCRIYLFDPSPTGRETMALVANQHPLIEYIPLGLAGSERKSQFCIPMNPDEGSYYLSSERSSNLSVPFDCISVTEFCRQRDIRRLDLLKLDIEGFEYEVLQNVLIGGVIPRQICVEFHHFLPGVPLYKTLKAIWGVRQHRLRLIHKDRCDLTFIRESP
jgi:FkbM family methyltransferase